jgi:hypothetical protein
MVMVMVHIPTISQTYGLGIRIIPSPFLQDYFVVWRSNQ